MKNTTIALALLCALAAPASTALAADAHDHHGAPAAGLQLDHGRKWATDEPLRQGMDALRGELAGRLHGIHTGKLPGAEYTALGRAIDGQVARMVAQCQLAPEADAMLHLVIARLLQAAEVLQGKAGGQPAGAAHEAALALNDYGRYFDHPGWQALR